MTTETAQTVAEPQWQRFQELRHAIHADPELGLELPRTQSKVLDALDGLGLEISTGKELSSVTAVLRGGAVGDGQPRPAVLLRADMDALPGREESGLPYASTSEAMHACGHDLHTAALVGAAHLLAGRRARLAGDVVFMFQPGEEGQGGARIMVDEGVLEAAGPTVSAAYALHVTSALLPQGWVATRGGPLMAAADVVRVTVAGAGGHGAQPHLAKDPVVAAAEAVVALQAMVTRKFDVFDPVVLNVGVFRAGTQHNVIPASADFEVSIRSFSAAARSRAVECVRELITGICLAHGLTAHLEHEPIYPVMSTDPAQTEWALDVARGVEGVPAAFALPNPVTSSEDFAYVLDRVPGAYLFLGACPAETDPGTAPANHSSAAVFDDAVLPTASRLLAALAAGRLAVSGPGAGS